MKDIVKVINYLEIREILLKGTTRTITKGRYLSLLGPLMAAVLSLMKSVLTPLAKMFCCH